MVKDQRLVYRLEILEREVGKEREKSVSVPRAATVNPSVQDETRLENIFKENKEQLCLVQLERISRDVEKRERSFSQSTLLSILSVRNLDPSIQSTFYSAVLYSFNSTHLF